MLNRPQLITYADRLAGDLRGVAQMLRGPLAGAFGGVHILPFFVPIDGADAGFDPADHTTVDPRVGDWNDIVDLAGDHEVMADLIINHVSDDSAQFRDWLARGSDSPYDGMFLTLSSVFPDGAPEAALAAIYRPRPGMPFTKVATADGSTRLAWTTFTSHQFDIDIESEPGREYLESVVQAFERGRVSLGRLDAVGYGIKRAGTSCFMIPETFDFIAEFAERCRRGGMEVLVEIHGYHVDQIDIAARVDLVYDFALPPLVLDAFYRGTSSVLRRWLEIRPTNCVTVLDTHDGIGIVDVAADPSDRSRPGLLDDDQVAALVAGIHERSGGTSQLATGAAASNLDIYQVNCTYYEALGRDDLAYLAARLIQVFTPGTPQVYYVGLLAGTNDLELLGATGVGRDINRHHYTPFELTGELDRPVVRALLALLRWRCRESALFDGEFTVLDTEDSTLGVRWSTADRAASLWVGLDEISFRLEIRADSETITVDSLEGLIALDGSGG